MHRPFEVVTAVRNIAIGADCHLLKQATEAASMV